MSSCASPRVYRCHYSVLSLLRRDSQRSCLLSPRSPVAKPDAIVGKTASSLISIHSIPVAESQRAIAASRMTSVIDSVRKHLPRSWNNKYTLETTCRELPEYDDEYRTVKDKFCNTLPSVTPDRIERVESPQLYGMYLLKKAEYPEDVKEMSLWHATSEANFANIIETNLDWRRAGRVKFGRGVSFSPSAQYANLECNRSNPTARVCILCKVLVKNAVNGSDTTTLPRQGYDTTTGNGGKVYVKYADYEFYPEYAVYYDSPPYVPPRRHYRW